MKKHFKSLLFLALAMSMILTACMKDKMKDKENAFGNEGAVLLLKSGYSTTVVETPEKPSDYAYYTKGLIHYEKDGALLASVNYGDGIRDELAEKDVNGIKEMFDLSAKNKPSCYSKVIKTPLIKTIGCDYIVAGIIEYYKNGQLIATVDYGDAVCDNLALKTWPAGSDGNKSWPAGSKEISLDYIK